MPTLEEALAQFISRVDRAVANFEASLAPMPLSPEILVFSHGFTRSVRLFRGIRSFVKAGLAPEAVVLARPLLEEVVRLQQMAASEPADRTALALGHLSEAADHARRLAKRSREAKLESSDGDWEKAAKAAEERVERYSARSGIAPRGFSEPKTYASGSDLTAKRNLFELEVLHFFVHGSAIINGFFENQERDVLTVGAPDSSMPSGDVLLLQTVDYIVQICLATATFFDIDPSPFEVLTQELKELTENLRLAVP